MIWTIPVILLVSILLFPWGLFSLVLLPLFAWKAYAAYRATGFCTTETELVIQGRPFISKQTNFMLKRRVQSVNYAQSIWMKKGNVVHFSVLLKSGQTHLNAGVHYIAVQDANQLYYWYQPSK